ncbi:MAG UNVERIFIED_CONTAM: toll/interleukin-1 receptor domain-containing protein [Planctomycetaceae bacterium]|jgi:hypothetical protein
MDREGSAITNAVGSTGAAEFSGNPNQSIVSGGRGTGRRGQIYIAYQKNDEEFVKDLHAYLKREGFTLFLDLVDLNTKQDHPPQFDKQLATSRCILIVWGENAYQSEWLRYEASVGRYRSIDLILRLGDAKIPDPWRLRARLDFSENGGAIQQGRITPSGKRKLIDEICSRIPDDDAFRSGSTTPFSGA